MTQDYFCERCKRFVTPVYAPFRHPDMGTKDVFVCNKCGTMVYKKEVKDGC